MAITALGRLGSTVCCHRSPITSACTRQPLRLWATTTTANTAGCLKQQLQAYSTARAWLRTAKPANKKLVEGKTRTQPKQKTGFSRALLAPNLRHSTTLSNPLYLHAAPSGASALAYTKAHTSLSEAVAAVWIECKPKSFGSCVWQGKTATQTSARPQPWFAFRLISTVSDAYHQMYTI